MIRAVLSFVIGYAVVFLLIVLTDGLMGLALRGQPELSGVVNLIVAAPYGFIGGYVSARIARGREMEGAMGLVVFAIVVTVVSRVVNPGDRPIWYSVLLMLLLVPGVLGGGYLRKRQTTKLA